MMRAIMNAPLPFFSLPPLEVATSTTITTSSASGLVVGDWVTLWQGPVTGKEGTYRIDGLEAPGTYCVTDTTKTHPPARNRHERRGGRKYR